MILFSKENLRAIYDLSCISGYDFHVRQKLIIEHAHKVELFVEVRLDFQLSKSKS